MLYEADFNTHDYAIGGKLVVGKAVMDESFLVMQTADPDARQNIKKSLVSQLAEYMLENNLVEFTQQKGFPNPHTFQEQTVIMVRAYLAPNDQVKILRLANKIL